MEPPSVCTSAVISLMYSGSRKSSQTWATTRATQMAMIAHSLDRNRFISFNI